MKVRNAINTTVVPIPEEASLEQAAASMRRNSVRVLVAVSDDGRPSGMITDGELIEKSAVSDPETTPVANAMSKEAMGCLEDTDADEALHMMLISGVQHLPVFNREGGLLGFVCALQRTNDIH